MLNCCSSPQHEHEDDRSGEELDTSCSGEELDRSGSEEESSSNASDSEDSDIESNAFRSVSNDINSSYLFHEEKIKQAIINWTIDCPNTPSSTISSLLRNFNVFYPDLPLTASTLRQVETNACITDMETGRYAHFTDWITVLMHHLKLVNFTGNLALTINIDGIGLFSDARKYHAYPILVKLPIPSKKIICAGIFISESTKKNSMPNVNVFLQKFVNDLSQLINDDILINNTRVKVTIKAFVCDRPARSDLKLIARHMANSSCERCIQPGTHEGRIVFLENSSPARTDENFANRSFVDHHQPGEMSIIANLGVGMVSSFALDYMHLACLGVCKRLLLRLLKSARGQTKVHMSDIQTSNVNAIIDRIAGHLPSDFNRRLHGGLTNIKHWKATELRTFFLYVGVLAFRGVLPEDQYINFLFFSVSMRVLLSKNQNENMDSVKKLLTNFILSSRRIYGNQFIVGNVHGLLHLPDDYLKWGDLDEVSCFPFESYLGQVVKGRLTGRFKPLEQLVRHITVENLREPKKKEWPSACRLMKRT